MFKHTLYFFSIIQYAILNCFSQCFELRETYKKNDSTCIDFIGQTKF